MQIQPVNKKVAILAERTMTKALFFLAVVAVLIATLEPFNPFSRNGVTWLQGTKGLKFQNAGLVISNEALAPAETEGPESFAVELLLRPATTKSVSTNTILAFDTPTPSTELLLRQWTDGLAISHEEATEHDGTKTTEVYVAHVFRLDRLVLVTISSGPDGTMVYLDGQPRQLFPHFRISRKDLSGKIVLGTSPMAYHPWVGELRGFAIYSKAMTPADVLRHDKEWNKPNAPPDLEGAIAHYSFSEPAGHEVRNDIASAPNLEIPVRFTVPHKGLLLSPAQERKVNSRYAFDVLTNIAGFVPLGLIGCAYFSWTRGRWEAVLFTTITCGILSLVIEVLQYYIPSRASGITDVITNTLGAALGGMLVLQGTVRRAMERLKLIRRAQPLCMVTTAKP